MNFSTKSVPVTAIRLSKSNTQEVLWFIRNGGKTADVMYTPEQTIIVYGPQEDTIVREGLWLVWLQGKLETYDDQRFHSLFEEAGHGQN